jgi:hypothetical protein
MTAGTDLLPLPRTLRHPSDADLAEHVQAYARACVSSATEALRAEVEDLEVQVAGLTVEVEHHTAYAITHRGALRYCNSNMRDAYSDEKVRAETAEARAERLAEALRELADAVFAEFCGDETESMEPDDSKVSYPEDRCHITFGMIRRARAALEQETTNG